MKRAVILHGTDNNPTGNWFPWLKRELERRGYQVWVPELPDNHTPNRCVYNDFLFGGTWDFTDNIVIGHSSGAVSVLNLLMDARCPHIKAGILVSAWAHMDGTDLPREQFKDLFPPEGFDLAAIKVRAGQLLFLHGSDDPYCPLEQAAWLAAQTGGDMRIVPHGRHLGDSYPQLPHVLALLEQNHLL